MPRLLSVYKGCTFISVIASRHRRRGNLSVSMSDTFSYTVLHEPSVIARFTRAICAFRHGTLLHNTTQIPYLKGTDSRSQPAAAGNDRIDGFYARKCSSQTCKGRIFAPLARRTPHPPRLRSAPVSLRLGHAAALTVLLQQRLCPRADKRHLPIALLLPLLFAPLHPPQAAVANVPTGISFTSAAALCYPQGEGLKYAPRKPSPRGEGGIGRLPQAR